LLSAAGHRVHAPTLIGLGDREAEFHAGIGWQTHVDEIADLITKSDLIDVVLVGHSYGGGIITGAADCVPERIYALIYLDAIVPQNGVPDWVGFPRERQDAMRAGAERFGGLRVPPPDPAIWGIQHGTAEHRDLQQRLAGRFEEALSGGVWSAAVALYGRPCGADRQARLAHEQCCRRTRDDVDPP
jgi:pimeloyl-ACP methyl ester carboxylesterase